MAFLQKQLGRLRRFFIRLSFRKQIVFSFTALTLGLLCLVGVTSISTFYGFAQQELEKNAEQNAAALNQNIERLVTEVVSSFSVAKNYDVVHFLRRFRPSGDYRSAYEVGNAIVNWRMLQSEDSPIVDVTILSIENYGYSERNGYFRADSALMQEPEYQELMDNPRKTHIWGSPIALNDMPWEQDVFCLATGVFRTGTNELAGVVRTSVQKSYLTRTLSDSRFSQSAQVLVYDRSGRLIFSDREEGISPLPAEEVRRMLAAESQGGIQTRKLLGTPTVMVYRPLAVVDWLVVSTVPSYELFQPMFTILQSLLLMLLLTVALAFLLNGLISSSVSRPLNEFAAHIGRVAEGDLRPIAHIEGSPEFQDLVRIFNCMVVDMGLLLQQVTREQENLKRSELKALQAQINPHFLYNSMDSAVWAAENGEMRAVIDLLTSLARFYRLTLSGGMDIIPFSVELGHVKSYLEVVHMRYQDVFTYELDADDACQDCLFPKIILQPLVENALYHGVKEWRYGDGKKGLIRVQARCEEGQLRILVSDDGKGMTEQELKLLWEKIQTESVSVEESYGLKSVHQRLQLYFGEGYQMRLWSVPGAGTSMELVVPQRKAEEGS